MIYNRLTVYMLVDHGVLYRDRSLASWQEVGQVQEGEFGVNLNPWRQRDPETRFEAGTAAPEMPYGYIRLPVRHAHPVSYRGVTDSV